MGQWELVANHACRFCAHGDPRLYQVETVSLRFPCHECSNVKHMHLELIPLVDGKTVSGTKSTLSSVRHMPWFSGQPNQPHPCVSCIPVWVQDTESPFFATHLPPQ